MNEQWTSKDNETTHASTPFRLNFNAAHVKVSLKFLQIVSYCDKVNCILFLTLIGLQEHFTISNRNDTTRISQLTSNDCIRRVNIANTDKNPLITNTWPIYFHSETKQKDSSVWKIKNRKRQMTYVAMGACSFFSRHQTSATAAFASFSSLQWFDERKSHLQRSSVVRQGFFFFVLSRFTLVTAASK